MTSLLPSGFPEYNPGEQIIFDSLINIIETGYQKYGYSHIHTPAVEANKVLLAKSGNETSKQIFGLYGVGNTKNIFNENLNNNNIFNENLNKKYDIKDYSLHFDLTIPFARYILDHEAEITFPFKRFQIQPVRRGERSQRGRFREFWQCDIDSVWRADTNKSMSFYDAETLIVIGNILEDICAIFFPNKGITIHYNNKRIIESLLEEYKEKGSILNLFDKYYKIGKEKFIEELKILTKNEDTQRILEFVDNPKIFFSHIKSADARNELILLEEHLDNMNTKKLNLVYDPFITRGLDYYTGTVFETFFDDDMALGSISSGGRYDGLTKYIDYKRSFSGVGGSIGLSRLMTLILENKEKINESNVKYLCINFKETFKDVYQIAETIREEGEKVEFYPIDEQINKQITYAKKKGIPNIIIMGEDELEKKIYKVKDLQTGTEIEFPLQNNKNTG